MTEDNVEVSVLGRDGGFKVCVSMHVKHNDLTAPSLHSLLVLPLV
jgi:hypothetical protein